MTDQHIAHPERLSASQAADAIAEGRLTVEELARALLGRIAERAEVKAWVHLDEDLIVREAQRLDAIPRHERKSPLFGVPVGVKDIFYTKDMPTQFGSERYDGNMVAADATVVSILREAGLLVFGKTATFEFAMGYRKGFPLTRNPHDLKRSPGASSAGSGAAVADFQVPLALGTQTQGSVICPASFCGIYGWKPTHSHISLAGVWSVSPTLDTCGLLARDVEDIRRFQTVISGVPIGASTGTIRCLLRIACCKLAGFDTAPVEVQEAYYKAVELLRGCSASFVVEEIELPAPFADYYTHVQRIGSKEFSVSFAAEIAKGPDGIGPARWDEFRKGQAVTWEEYKASVEAVAELKRMWEKIIEQGDFDATVTLGVPMVAPVDEHFSGVGLLASLWTVMHLPMICIPPGFGAKDSKTPHDPPQAVGMSLVGKEHGDAHLLAVAAKISELFREKGDWHSEL